MKNIRGLYALMLIPVLSAALAGSAAAMEKPWLNAGKTVIRNAEERSFTFTAVPSERTFMWVEGLVRLPAGEGWGDHALKLTLNGRIIDDGFAPLNRQMSLVNPVTMGTSETPLFDPQRKTWFLRYDSDTVPFNADAPNPYARTASLNGANCGYLKGEFYSGHYRYVFDVTSLMKKGQNTLKVAALLSEGVEYPVELTSLRLAPMPALTLFARPWMEMLFPWSVPGSGEMLSELSAAAAPGERVPIVFSAYALQEMKDLSVSVSIDGLPQRACDMRLIEESPRKESLDNFMKSSPAVALLQGRKPSLPHLLAALPEKTDLAAGGTRSFWISFQAPESAAPGDYRGRVLLTIAGRQMASLPLKITLRPFKLPPFGELPFSVGLFTMADHMPGQQLDETIKLQLQDIAEHGIDAVMMSPWTSPLPISGVKGNIRVDMERLKRDIDFLQQAGLNRRYISYGTMEPVLAQIGKITGKKLRDPEFDDVFVEVMGQLFRRAADEKWPLYIVPLDEPNYSKKNWEDTIHIIRLVKRVPGGRVWINMTESASAKYLFDQGLIDKHDVPSSHPTSAWSMDAGEYIKGFHVPSAKAGWVRDNLFWEYWGMAATPSYHFNRGMCGLMAWKMRLRTYWAFAWYWGNNRQADAWHKWAYIAYPFPTGQDGRLYSTVGWEAMRQGVEDYRYLYLLFQTLKEKYGEKRARDEVDAFAADIPLALEQSQLNQKLGPDGSDAIRQRLAGRITEELKGAKK